MGNRKSRGQQRDKPFRDALRMEVAAAQEAGDKRSLRRIARKLLDRAAGGDMSAIKEVADRLDGKVAQAVVGDGKDDPIKLINRIERVIVRHDPENRDGSDIQAPSESGSL